MIFPFLLPYLTFTKKTRKKKGKYIFHLYMLLLLVSLSPASLSFSLSLALYLSLPNFCKPDILFLGPPVMPLATDNFRFDLRHE